MEARFFQRATFVVMKKAEKVGSLSGRAVLLKQRLDGAWDVMDVVVQQK